MSNTLRNVGLIGAGFLGSLLGPAAFAPFGSAIGTFLFGLVLPPKSPDVKAGGGLSGAGQRTTSAGQAIWEVFGQIERDGGDLLRCAIDSNGQRSGIVEVTTTTNESAGGGGVSGSAPKQKVETVNSYLNASFAFSEGPTFIDRIIETNGTDGEKVIFDRYNSLALDDAADLLALYKALYNSTNLTDAEAIQADIEAMKATIGEAQGIVFTSEYSPVTGKLIAEISEHIRLYFGTEEQQPDSVEETWYDEGVGADRGVCKMVLSMYGPLQSGTSFRLLLNNYRTTKRSIITSRLQRSGIPASRIFLRSIPADAEDFGWYVDAREAARALPEQVAAKAFHDLQFIPMEEGAAFTDVSRMNPTYIVLDNYELGAYSNADNSGQTIPSSTGNIQTGESKPRELTTLYIDQDQNFKSLPAISTSLDSRGEPQSVTYRAVGTLQEFQDFTDVAMAEIQVTENSVQISLMPHQCQAAPGCVLIVPERTVNEPSGYLMQKIVGQKPNPNGIIVNDTVSYDPQAYGRQRTVVIDPAVPPTFIVYDTPEIIWIDNVSLTDDMAMQPTLLAVATIPSGGKWGGATVSSNAFPTFDILNLGTVGESETDYTYGDAALYTFDYDTTLRVSLSYGSLASISESDFLTKRANILYWGGTYLTFITATPVSPGVYDITGLMPGLFGSDNIRSIDSGAVVVQIANNDGLQLASVKPVGMSVSKINQTISYEAWATPDSRKTTGPTDLLVEALNLKALAPSPGVLKGSDGAGGYILRFYARTRYPESSTAYLVSGVPVRFSDPLTFSISLLDGSDVVDTRTVTSVTGEVDVVYTMAELVTAFGSVPGTLTGSVYEQGLYGNGFIREFEDV